MLAERLQLEPIPSLNETPMRSGEALRQPARNFPNACASSILARHRVEPTSGDSFHGKEGVDGSSPSEGLKSLQIGLVRCLFRRNQERSMEGVSKSPICRGSGDA